MVTRADVDYTTLSLADLADEFVAMGNDVQSTFGSLDDRQLNWRPDDKQWSVAQCFDHLLSANAQMLRSADLAMDGSRAKTVWQRLPVLPRVFGALMIRSQSPQAVRKFVAPRQAQPSCSTIVGAIIERFSASQHDYAARVRALRPDDAARVIMVSPFVSFIAYSVIDGYRLVVAHQRRHFEQARRVVDAAGFPARQR